LLKYGDTSDMIKSAKWLVLVSWLLLTILIFLLILRWSQRRRRDHEEDYKHLQNDT